MWNGWKIAHRELPDHLLSFRAAGSIYFPDNFYSVTKPSSKRPKLIDVPPNPILWSEEKNRMRSMHLAVWCEHFDLAPGPAGCGSIDGRGGELLPPKTNRHLSFCLSPNRRNYTHTWDAFWWASPQIRMESRNQYLYVMFQSDSDA